MLHGEVGPVALGGLQPKENEKVNEGAVVEPYC